MVLASTACLCPGSTGWGQGSHTATITTLGPEPPPCAATTSTNTYTCCKHQNGHLVYIHCRREFAYEWIQRPLRAPQHLRKHGKRARTARRARGPLSLPSQEQRRGEAGCEELGGHTSLFLQHGLNSSSKAAQPFWWLPSPPILLSYNLTKKREPALPHTWKSTQLHYIIQRPSSVFCKGFPFPSPYPTKNQGLSFTSGQTYLHVDCSRIQPRRLKSCKKGAGDTNWDLPAHWELTVIQPWGNPQHRHEFFPTNTQQASQLPGKLLQLLAKGQLGLNLLEVNLLDPAQSGFKPGCGSGAIQVALMDEALLSAGRGHPSILILLDFSTNHEILLSCLTGGRSPG